MDFNSYIVSDTKTALSFGLGGSRTRKTNVKSRFRFAFTLAETLITLTIIGVIAALTIPTLYSNYQKHTWVVGLKKAYSELQQAVKMIPLTEGCPAGDFECTGMFAGIGNNPGSITDVDGQTFNGLASRKIAYFFSKQLKNNGLHLETAEKCFFINGFCGDAYFYTDDGMYFEFANASIGVDINGDKGPNKIGRDRFYFNLAYQSVSNNIATVAAGTVLPNGSSIERRFDSAVSGYAGEPYPFWSDCTSQVVSQESGRAFYCTGRVLEEDAMNY